MTTIVIYLKTLKKFSVWRVTKCNKE